MRPLTIASRLVFAAIAVVANCMACSFVYTIIQVGPNFRVKVADRGRSIKGLPVALSTGTGGNRVVASTDSDGFVLFRGISPGSWRLTADHEAGIEYGAALEVKPHGPPNKTVPLQWPETPSVSTRSLKGAIHGPDYLPGHPQPELSFDVLAGSSRQRLQILRTNDRGEFDIEGVAPGYYFLNLKPSGLIGWSNDQITGEIAVLVDPNAATDHLDLDLGWTNCGLHYADNSKCRQSDLRMEGMERLEGRIVDTTGAAIPRAKIFLLDPAGTPVEQLQSDNDGKFAAPRPLPEGIYELVVSSPGFTSYRRTARVEPNGESVHPFTLTMQLGFVAGCSVADSQ